MIVCAPLASLAARSSVRALLLFSLLLPLGARAQSTADIAAARALFDEGVRLADAGDLGSAEDRFRRSLALNPVPAVAFNLAYVLAQQGRNAEAVDYYSQVASNGASPADLRQQASSRGQQLLSRTARLRVSLLGPPDGISLRIGRRILGASAIGVPIHVDPGSIRVEAMRAAQAVAFGDVQLAAGAEGALSLRIPPAPSLWESPWLWTVVGVAVAGAAVAIIAAVALSGTDPSYTGNIPPGVVLVP